jgi:hypothetical protein
LAKAQQLQLLTKGPFSPERMPHIAKIIIVLQSPAKTQVTIAKDLSIPHGQYVARRLHVELPTTDHVGVPIAILDPERSGCPQTPVCTGLWKLENWSTT